MIALVSGVPTVIGTVGSGDRTEVRLTQSAATAEEAKTIADNTNQYFWNTSEGSDTGVHITQIPQEDFIDNPTSGGGNTLLRSNGLAVRDGLTELAVFGSSGIQLGEFTNSHLSMDYHSMRLVDKDNNTYFYISDLRDSTGKAQVVETCHRWEDTDSISVINTIDSNDITILDEDNNVVPSADISFTLHDNTINIANSQSLTFYVSYWTEGALTKAFTIGERNSLAYVGNYTSSIGYGNEASGNFGIALGYGTKATGNYSLASGHNTEASGNYSYAEGDNTLSSGFASHAEGYGTEANGDYSHAQGENTIANGMFSFASGYDTTATGLRSFAGGYKSEAYGTDSLAYGNNLLANGNAQTVLGK